MHAGRLKIGKGDDERGGGGRYAADTPDAAGCA